MSNIPEENVRCCTLLGNPFSYQKRVCRYFIFDNAQPGTKEDKANKLLNYICGPKNQAELIEYVNGYANRNALNGVLCEGTPPVCHSMQYSYWNLVYPLIFPPILDTVYALNNSGSETRIPHYNNGRSVKLPPSDYHAIPNPFINHATAVAGLIFGATLQGAMPCRPSYSLPYSIELVQSGNDYYTQVVYEDVVNPNYEQCFAFMVRQLSQPQTIGNAEFCVGDTRIFLNNAVGYDQAYIETLVHSDAGRPPRSAEDLSTSVIGQFLSSVGSGSGALIFLRPQQVGPYDTTTKQPCTDLTSKTCTYQICKNAPARGWNCTSNGCQPQYNVPGSFATKDDCEKCYLDGSCPGDNICCPDSVKVGGVCPKPTPGVTPNTNVKTEIIITLAVLAVLVIGYIVYRFVRRRK